MFDKALEFVGDRPGKYQILVAIGHLQKWCHDQIERGDIGHDKSGRTRFTSQAIPVTEFGQTNQLPAVSR